LSYVYRSAKFDAKFFNFFARLFILLYYRSDKFRTSVNGKIKLTSERKSKKISQIGKLNFRVSGNTFSVKRVFEQVQYKSSFVRLGHHNG